MDMRILMWAVLALIVLLVLKSLISRDKNAESPLKLDDLLLGDDGKMSKAAIVFFGSFLMTTWMMIYLTIQGKMTEGYFGLYSAAWIAPTVTALIFRGIRQVGETKNDSSTGTS